jgi:hypothetical protein
LEFAVALLISLSVSGQVPEAADDDETIEVPSRLSAPPLATMKPLPPEADLRASWKLADGGYVVGEGAKPTCAPRGSWPTVATWWARARRPGG